MTGFDDPRHALVVVAHPDDIDFGMAGTVATLTAAGTEVTYCLVTSGEAGPPDDMDRDELRELREREQTAAAAEVGVTDLRFLHLPDGRLEPNLALRRDISRVIRQVRPDLVIAQSGMRTYDSVYRNHPDHLAVGEATASAVYPDSRNRWAHTELLAEELEPHAVERMWIGGGEPNHFVDITDVFDRKLAALRRHASQVSGFEDLDGLLRNWAAGNAVAAGWPPGRLAEAFRQIDCR
jgi:LmbE family N-acetylglucosaminyl deacetylase